MSVINRTIVEQYKRKNDVVQQIKRTKQVQLVGESMIPTLDSAKILTLFVSCGSDFKIGDVVVFKYSHSVVGVVVHRIIKRTGNIVITKGDNNLQCDESIDSSAIIGKVEKALMKDMSIRTVRSSSLVARLSKVENSIVRWIPCRFKLIAHSWLTELYKFLMRKEENNR